MKNSEIYSRIENTYNSETGKNFITHLLRSFFPTHKAFQVIFKPEKEGKEVKLVCCITNEKLNSRDEMMEKVLFKHEDLFKESMASIKAELSEQPKPETPVKESLKKELKDFKQAIGS